MNSPAQPAASRTYGYLLGGTDNYPAEFREFFLRCAEFPPG